MRAWRVALIVLFGAFGIGWAATPAQADDGVRLSATSGWSGRCHAGKPILVRVHISADRLVSGVLSAEAIGPTSAVTEVPVEVAGGTEEDVLLVTSSPFGCGSLLLRLREDRGTTTLQLGTSDAGDTVLLGLLPGARSGTVPSSALARTGVAAVTALEPDLLDRAGAIGGLDSIGATPADLDGLSADQRRALAGWVTAGGALLVDAAGPEALGALPEEWRPAAGGRVKAGHGQVLLTRSALRDGRLDGLAEPAAGASRGLGGGVQVDGTTLGGVLQKRSGLRRLSLPLILGVLGFYVVLVGPGVRVGLRRLGRLQLTWLVVPFTALVFTGLAVAGGDLLRRGGKPTHLSVVETEVAGARSRTYVGVPTRNKGAVVGSLPAGWLADVRGFEEREARTTIRTTAIGERVQAEGQPGGFVILGAEGASQIEGRLTVQLGRDGRVGTAKNDLRVPLEDVAVLAPGGVTKLGRLEPGATTPFTVPAGKAEIDARALAQQAWGTPGNHVADADAFPMLASAQSRVDVGVSLMVAGWTTQLATPLQLRKGEASGTTLVLGRPADGPPVGELVGGTSSNGMQTTRFVVPRGGTYRLSLDQGRFGGPIFRGPSGAGGSIAEVLVAGSWVVASDGVALPGGATTDGVVYVRSALFGASSEASLEPA